MALDLVGFGGVGHAHGHLSGCALQGVERGTVAPGGHDGGAPLGSHQGRGPPDAAGGSENDDDLLVERIVLHR
jgi:hypothetical protein